MIIQVHKIEVKTDVSVVSAALVSESGNCGKNRGNRKREIRAGISERDKTHNNVFHYYFLITTGKTFI